MALELATVIDLPPHGQSGGLTDGRILRFPLYSTRHRLLWGCCPKLKTIASRMVPAESSRYGVTISTSYLTFELFQMISMLIRDDLDGGKPSGFIGVFLRLGGLLKQNLVHDASCNMNPSSIFWS